MVHGRTVFSNRKRKRLAWGGTRRSLHAAQYRPIVLDDPHCRGPLLVTPTSHDLTIENCETPKIFGRCPVTEAKFIKGSTTNLAPIVDRAS